MMRRFVSAAPKAAMQQARNLSIHEFQAKQILRDNGCTVEAGTAVYKLEDVQAACDSLPGTKKVVKSQILAGGRGRGHFLHGFQV